MSESTISNMSSLSITSTSAHTSSSSISSSQHRAQQLLSQLSPSTVLATSTSNTSSTTPSSTLSPALTFPRPIVQGNNRFILRHLQMDDFEKGYMELLSQLTKTGNVDKEKFQQRFIAIHGKQPQHNYPLTLPLSASDMHQQLVIEDQGMTEEEIHQVRQLKETNANALPLVSNTTPRIIGAASLVLEYKFIRECGIVGHIEDVVIDSKYRGLNLGFLMVQSLVQLGESLDCYKIILDCEPKNVTFYEKLGFADNAKHLALYFKK